MAKIVACVQISVSYATQKLYLEASDFPNDTF